MNYWVEYWKPLRVYMVKECEGGQGRGEIFNEQDAAALVAERPGLADAFFKAKDHGMGQMVSQEQTVREDREEAHFMGAYCKPKQLTLFA